jgi:uncharacterized protein (TIGR02271 family)
MPAQGPRQPASETDPTLALPVVQEELHVRIHTVERGGVRVHKHVHEAAHEVDVPLAHEVLEVTHVPVDRIVPLDQPPSIREEGDTLIVPVLEEVLVVEKRLRVKEEIHIQRRQEVRHHTETVQLRAETADIERLSSSTERNINPADTPGDST